MFVFVIYLFIRKCRIFVEIDHYVLFFDTNDLFCCVLCLHCKYVNYVLVTIKRLILQCKIVVLTYISHLPPLICFVCSIWVYAILNTKVITRRQENILAHFLESLANQSATSIYCTYHTRFEDSPTRIQMHWRFYKT